MSTVCATPRTSRELVQSGRRKEEEEEEEEEEKEEDEEEEEEARANGALFSSTLAFSMDRERDGSVVLRGSLLARRANLDKRGGRERRRKDGAPEVEVTAAAA
uniref:Uncharacterized protein n=1 Tax=Vespula pensylvanica TaxID=30213 RepID=A0A834JI81_VESPE|nr:hypothetical protein H0235_018276 [Vespula pensylvanica]